MKIIIKNLSREKVDLEELIMKQENKVTDLAAKIKIVEKNMKEKNKEIAENEENTIKLINILEDQKKQIENLSKIQDSGMSNKIVLTTKDEIQLKKVISEKENEITTLKVYNENLKADVHSINITKFFISFLNIFLSIYTYKLLAKDQNIAAMQKTLSRYQEEIKRLKFVKIELAKNMDNNREKENEIKNNTNPSNKLFNKKIKLEAKDYVKDNEANLMDNYIKNKLNNKKSLIDKNQDNYNIDLKLPDINKNQKILGINKKYPSSNKERIEKENLNSNYKEKEYENLNANENPLLIKKDMLKRDYSGEYKNKYNNQNVKKLNENFNEENTINEKKRKHFSRKKISGDEEKFKNKNLDTSNSIQNLEEENEININEISNMMKNILNDENQII